MLVGAAIAWKVLLHRRQHHRRPVILEHAGEAFGDQLEVVQDVLVELLLVAVTVTVEGRRLPQPRRAGTVRVHAGVILFVAQGLLEAARDTIERHPAHLAVARLEQPDVVEGQGEDVEASAVGP